MLLLKASTGPWTVDEQTYYDKQPNDGYAVYRILDDCGDPVPLRSDAEHEKGQAEANARLMAAAPELYQALSTLLMGFESFDPVRIKACSALVVLALRKAEKGY